MCMNASLLLRDPLCHDQVGSHNSDNSDFVYVYVRVNNMFRCCIELVHLYTTVLVDLSVCHSAAHATTLRV